LSERARFARVSRIATFLTCHSRLSLVNLLVWRFQFFHEKIHLGCQHINTVNFMYSLCMGRLPICLPTLVGNNLVDEHSSSCNIEGEECSSRYCVHVILRSLVQAIEEVLNDKLFFHAVVWACCNVFLKTFPGFRDCHILELLKTGNSVPKGIGFAHRKVLDQKSIGARIPSVESFLEGVEPHLCFPKQREWEQSKTNIIHCSASWVDYAAHF